MTRSTRILTLMLTLLVGGTAHAESAAQKAAQATWKELAKVRLASFKQAMSAATAQTKTAIDAYIVELGDPSTDEFDCGEDLAVICLPAYSKVQAAIETAVRDLDADASGLLTTLGMSSLRGFMAGDGGTSDQALAEIRARVSKFDKFMRKRIGKVRKAVAKSGEGAVRLSAVLYPLPVTMSPLAHDSDSALDGLRPNAPLFAFGVTDAGMNMYGITGGITSAASISIEMKQDDLTVATIAPGINPRGIYTHQRVFTIVPANMAFEVTETGGTAGWTSFVGATFYE